jgi:hypothetical protein
MAQIIPLTTQEAANAGGFTHQIILLAADVAAMTSATALSIYPTYNSATTKTNLIVGNVAMYVKTAFNAFQSDGTTAVTLTLSVGDGTTATLFTAATTLKTAGAIINANTTMKVLAGDIIKITPTFGASGDPTKTTAGELRIYLQIVDLGNLAK